MKTGKRIVWLGQNHHKDNDTYQYDEILELVPIGFEDTNKVRSWIPGPEETILVGSATDRGTHQPVIDLDFGCRLIESSTPGHYHLYLDQEITIDKYIDLMEGFVKAGLVQEIHLDTLKEVRENYVRLPGSAKNGMNGLS